MQSSLCFLALLALSLPAAGQLTGSPPDQPEPFAPPPPPLLARLASELALPLDQVFFDEPGDGALWARGQHWKMRFGPEGARYHAAFSRSLPSLELDLSPKSVLLAGKPLPFGAPGRVRRAEERVELERCSFVEAYQLAPDAIEQLFVFSELPRRGGLELRIPLPAVAFATATEQGLRLETTLGELHYGRAIAIDARGRRVAAPTSFEEGAIVIRVDADFVSAAALPLVIDPIVAHTWIDLTPTDCRNPDAVFDSFTDRWIVVLQEVFSSTDSDVRVVAIDFNGFVTHLAYIDQTSTTWALPRIAHLRSETSCLVVCEVGPNLSRRVRGRTARPTGITFSLGAVNTISNDLQSGEKSAPTVGGNWSFATPARFCVAFQRELLATMPDQEIQYALVDGTGQVVLGPIPIAGGGLRDVEPSLSRSNGAWKWTLAFTRVQPFPFVGDIHAAYIDPNGTLSPVFSVTAGGIPKDARPTASSPMIDVFRSAIAFERRTVIGGQSDVMVAAIEDGVVIDLVNISLLEETGNAARDQIEPAIDCDGAHFLLSYAESFDVGHPNYTTRVSDLFLSGNHFGVRQAYQELIPVGTTQRASRVAAARINYSGPNRFMIPFHVTFLDPTQFDVGASQFESLRGGTSSTYCFGDGSSEACPCGNSPAPGHGCPNSAHASGARLIHASGDPSILADTVVLGASNLPPGQPCLFFQGTIALSGQPFGDGLRCAGGTVRRLATKSAAGGQANYPDPGEPSVSQAGMVPFLGEPRTYQVWYRDPGSDCTGARFNLTNGVSVLWSI
jgi:hypothetical protein